MKLRLFIFLTSLFSHVYSQPTTWQWAESALGAGSESANSITTDAAGNVFVTGFYYSGTISFGTYTLTNNGNFDVFVTKYDPSGNVLWSQGAGGLYDDLGCGITTDASGNVIVTGQFTSPTITFGTYTLTNSGITDIFTVKYDNAGNVLWAKNEGGSGSDEGNAICTDASGNIFITGQFQSPSLTVGSHTLSNSGIGDVFLINYDSSGNVIWAKSAGNNNLDVAYAVTTNTNGEVYLAGSFKSASLTFGSYTLTNSGSGYTDIFITRYDAAGSVQWAKSAGGLFDDVAYGITMDPSGNVLLTGSYKSSALQFGTYTLTNASTTNCDIFTVKYDVSGNELWAKGEGGNFDDIAYGVTTDAGGNIFVTGHVHSTTVSFGPTTYTTVGVGDLFLLNYTSSGIVAWSTTVGGLSDEGTSSICSDANGNIYVSGSYYSSMMNFGSHTLTNSGSGDVLVAKLSGVTGISEAENTNKPNLLLYPNPSAGKFRILMQEPRGVVSVFNTEGSVIYYAELTSDFEVDLSDKPKGVYFVTVNSSTSSASAKIILD